MSSTQDSPYRTLKAKRTSTHPPALANPGHSGPTTFFLRSEKEVERSAQRGRKISRDSIPSQEEDQTTPMANTMDDSSFGVQSLEDTVKTANASEDVLSRTNSNLSEVSVEAGADASMLAGRKRKAGNPVHPKIMATGQRIISADHGTHATGSPVSHRSADSPSRRRNSASSSSVNLSSQPLTPLKMSPRPESAMPSTPRSGSPKSFRLSDEEQSAASDAGSQAIVSSSGDENEAQAQNEGSAMPQLVMPSIAMPTRRPFTERGRQMGRLKVMVVGPRGIGKTSLIQSICRTCEDIVHMDAIHGSTSTAQTNDSGSVLNRQTTEIGASTRPYPSWWTDFETRRMLLQRQSLRYSQKLKSVGDGVLERNVMFIDTTGPNGPCSPKDLLDYFEASLSRIGSMAKMSDLELISALSGEGGLQIDAVLYLFDPARQSRKGSSSMEQDEIELLKYLCNWTNVIPLIGKADTVQAEDMFTVKRQVLDVFKSLSLEPYVFRSSETTEDDGAAGAEEPAEPYAISSALGDDPETIDASILMSSGYLQPLVSSELDDFVQQFLEPDNIARLRHLSAIKFLLWRQVNLGAHINLPKQTLSTFEPSSPVITGTGSLLDDPSKILVPHASSSYFRSPSPSAASDSSVPLSTDVTGTSAQALAHYNDQTNNTSSIPFRQIRLAKWAQDLQRSLDNERRRYKQMFTTPPSDWLTSPNTASSDSEKAATRGADPNTSLTTTSNPGKGRLGGALGIIDPRDPLGVLAFGQAFGKNSWFALQIAGSCGLIGAVAWWMMRNWAELQDFLRPAPQMPMTVTAVPPPASKMWWEDFSWRNLLGLEG